MLGMVRTLPGTLFHALTKIENQNGQAETESEPSKILFDKIFDFCEHKFPLRYLGFRGPKNFFKGFGILRFLEKSLLSGHEGDLRVLKII